jgi:hypothetical protein
LHDHVDEAGPKLVEFFGKNLAKKKVTEDANLHPVMPSDLGVCLISVLQGDRGEDASKSSLEPAQTVTLLHYRTQTCAQYLIGSSHIAKFKLLVASSLSGNEACEISSLLFYKIPFMVRLSVK